MKYAKTIRELNAQAPDVFPPLTHLHLLRGQWLLVKHETYDFPVGFAGLVPFHPFPKVGYFKRCYIDIAHVGQGLQLRTMRARERIAKAVGYKQVVSECSADSYSNRNFVKAGWMKVDPEQPWGKPGSVYWSKDLK